MTIDQMAKRLAEIEKQISIVTDVDEYEYADLYIEREELIAFIMDCKSQMEEQAIDDEIHNR